MELSSIYDILFNGKTLSIPSEEMGKVEQCYEFLKDFVARKLQFKTEKCGDKNKGFCTVSMEDSLECGLFSDHITSHRQTWNIRKRCFQRVSESK